MAPKENPKIRKAKRAPKTVKNAERVIVVDAGVIGGQGVASEFSEDEVAPFLEKFGLPISTKVRVPNVDEHPDKSSRLGINFPSTP